MKTVFSFLMFYGEGCRVLFEHILYATKLKKRQDPLTIISDQLLKASLEMFNGITESLIKDGITDKDLFLTPKYKAIAINAGLINENGVITEKGREMMGDIPKLIDLLKTKDLN